MGRGITNGQVFGRWTALFVGSKTTRCRCGCGTVRDVATKSLLNGASRSCGCLRSERSADRMRTHGRSKSAEYRSWRHMINRCTNPNVDSFPYYGGRGIRVCERWTDSFEAFFDDMGPRPSPHHTIERRDNNGNYEPANCVWATRTEQSKNRKNTIFIQVGEVRLALAEWSRKNSIPIALIHTRIRLGWDPGRAATEPVNKPRSA